MKTKLNLILIRVLGLIVTGCNKDEIKQEVFEAEGYVIGYHPCVANSDVITS